MECRSLRVEGMIFPCLQVFWAKLTGQEGVRPEFTWKAGQMPEQVCQTFGFILSTHDEVHAH